MPVPAPRYAIYYAPDPVSALWEIGSRFVGYDASSGQMIEPFPEVARQAGDFAQLMAEPSRYGFHGTLVAPFTLNSEVSEAELINQIGALTTDYPAVAIGNLRVSVIDKFVALVPEKPPTEVLALHTALLQALQPIMAPLSATDRARRRPELLSQRQREHLDRWGYPYVLDEFQFHLTLTGRAEPDVLIALGDTARTLFGECLVAAEIDAASIFVQLDRNDRFNILSRHVLAR